MWKPEEPNGRFGRWGQFASALATFGFLWFVIVFVILDWLVGAPAWVLWTACVPIAVFALAWGFTVVEDDEPEPETFPDEEEKLRWVFDKPIGAKAWIGRIALIWFGVGGVMGLGELLCVDGLGLSERKWALAALPLLALSIAIFFFELEEADKRAGLPDAAPTRDSANARFHEHPQS